MARGDTEVTARLAAIRAQASARLADLRMYDVASRAEAIWVGLRELEIEYAELTNGDELLSNNRLRLAVT